ncbi:hypothetical protein EJD97_013698 [Solanum chilense]|uniref:Uncharacterized protein n=1 Tax=Solanum chilense TaxID=4083 RepID=A0A6N2BCX4_SOLCI|nr:hypothetical protein EJD97_013698 [Solanum chilense]
MAPKLYIVYSRGRSKSVEPSSQIIGISDDERDPEYVPSGTRTPTLVASATRGNPKKVVSTIVTGSQSDEKHRLTSTPFGSALILKEHMAPKWHQVQSRPTLRGRNTDSNSGSLGTTHPEVLYQQASNDEAYSLESASSHKDDVPAPFPDYPNRWCVDGQYQVYKDTKVLNEKGMVTRLGPEPEIAPVQLAEDTVLASLFTTPLLEPRKCAKRHRSNLTTEREDAHATKERTNLKATRTASLIDKETHQIRIRELDTWVSSFITKVVEWSITEGAYIFVGTTEGDPTTEVSVSKKSDPPAC